MVTISKDLFDEIEELNQGDIFDQIALKENSKPFSSRIKSIGRAAAKGLTKAATNIQEINPLSTRGPLTIKQQRSALESLIGKPEEGFAEKLTERFAENAPLLLGGGGSIAPKLGRATLSSLLGQGAEEMGGGEIAQIVAELAGLGAPGLGKKIIPKKSQEKMVELLRRKGLSEKEIAPLIPSEKMISGLSKVTPKSNKIKSKIYRTKEAVGNIYEDLEKKGQELPILSSNHADILKSDLKRKLEKLPTDLRKPINIEIEDVFKKPIKGDDLIRLWRSINSSIYSKGSSPYRKKLNVLKEDISNSLEDISPELAKDFKTTNEAYAKAKSVYKKINPGESSAWKNLDKKALLIYSAINAIASSADPLVALSRIGKGYIVTKAVGKFATEMLTNPRLQNLSKQMAHAVKNNQIVIAKKIEDKIQKELEKQDIHFKENLKEHYPSKK